MTTERRRCDGLAGSSHGLPALRQLIARWMLLLGLVYATAWMGARWITPQNARLALPIGQGRAIHIRAWPELYLEAGRAPGLVEQNLEALWFGVWYQPRPAAPLKRYLSFTLPRWPMPALAIGSAVGLLAMLPRPRHKPPRGGTGVERIEQTTS